MAGQSKPMVDDRVVEDAPPWKRYTPLHGGAIIAHALSYVTTLWFVQWIWPEGVLNAQSAVASCPEFLLFAMKSALWNWTLADIGQNLG